MLATKLQKFKVTENVLKFYTFVKMDVAPYFRFKVSI